MLTTDRLKELLDYDPATGVFTWLVATRRIRVGDMAGCTAGGYCVIRADGVLYKAHRLAWLYVYGVWPTGGLDHKDVNGLNNRIDNLRPANQSQNGGNSNTSRSNSSGLKGASWHRKSQKWRGQITVRRKNISLGLFPTKELAHAAYCEAAIRHFGEFARAS